MVFDAEKVPDEMDDAIQALQSLGYSRAQAHKAMKKLEKSGDLTGNLEELLKKTLKEMKAENK